MKSGEIESISTPRELFSRGNDLVALGLDLPFTVRLQESLQDIGWQSKEYRTETELEDDLWEFLSKM
ncbi:cobalt transporter ATP-binding subunit [Streptococcus equi subsp. equi]|nr:cobalt transporter ATP-binding subunit [Streptococcus equi subsp. equi]